MSQSVSPRVTMPKVKHVSEEQSVSDAINELEKLLRYEQALENDFEDFIKVNSRIKSRYGVKGCDQKSATDAQSSSSMLDKLFFWRRRDFLFFWRRFDLLFFWRRIDLLFLWRRRQNTELDETLKSDSRQVRAANDMHATSDDMEIIEDKILLQELEQSMRSKFKDTKELIECCKNQFAGLSQKFVARLKSLEKQNKDLLIEVEKLKKESGGKEPDNAEPNIFSRFIFGAGNKKRQVTFQLYCQQQADVLPSIMTNLIEELRTHLSKNSIELKEKIVKSASDIAIDLPLIVICLHAFRLGPDVSGAIRGIQSRTNVAVLIVHHKDVFALPSESSNQILLGKDYSEIGAIIDIGFLEGKGIYQCGMNNNAIKELANFIIHNNKP